MNATTKSPSTGKTVAQLNEELDALALQIPKKKGDDRKNLLAEIDAKQKEIDDVVKNRELALEEVQSSIAMYEFTLSELTEATRTILGAVQAKGAKAAAESTDAKKKNQRSAEVDFGLIPFADFGFKPTKTDEKALHFKVNKMYGPTENGEFVKVVRAEVMKKGVGILDKYMGDEFKAWIGEFKEGAGPKVGQKLYLNKRDFMAYWNLKEDGSIDPKATKALPEGVTVASLIEAAKKAKK